MSEESIKAKKKKSSSDTVETDTIVETTSSLIKKCIVTGNTTELKRILSGKTISLPKGNYFWMSETQGIHLSGIEGSTGTVKTVVPNNLTPLDYVSVGRSILSGTLLLGDSDNTKVEEVQINSEKVTSDLELIDDLLVRTIDAFKRAISNIREKGSRERKFFETLLSEEQRRNRRPEFIKAIEDILG